MAERTTPLRDDCGSCRFWILDQDEFGSCRRRAPVPGIRSVPVILWPVTHKQQWCGEWERETW